MDSSQSGPRTDASQSQGSGSKESTHYSFQCLSESLSCHICSPEACNQPGPIQAQVGSYSVYATDTVGPTEGCQMDGPANFRGVHDDPPVRLELRPGRLGPNGRRSSSPSATGHGSTSDFADDPPVRLELRPGRHGLNGRRSCSPSGGQHSPHRVPDAHEQDSNADGHRPFFYEPPDPSAHIVSDRDLKVIRKWSGH